MTILFKTDSFGRIVSRIDLIDPDLNHYADFISDERCEDRHTHFIDGEFKIQPEKPSFTHDWNEKLFSWEVSIEKLRAAARNRITASRNLEEQAGFMAYGKLIDSDSASIARINTSVQAANAIGEAFSIDWTCADNSVITLDYAQMVCMPVLMAQAANLLHEKARALKAQIDAASTPEEINAVTW